MARLYTYTPEQLEKKAKEYFEYCENNPLYKYDCVKTGQDAGKELKIRLSRPYTIQGLCLWLNVDSQSFYNWVDGTQKNKELFEIATRVREIIQDNQISGAAAGIYQPVIVSRLNGLAEKVEQTTTSIDTTNKSKDEIKAAIQAIEQARKGANS